jgi:hypothetical protein
MLEILKSINFENPDIRVELQGDYKWNYNGIAMYTVKVRFNHNGKDYYLNKFYSIDPAPLHEDDALDLAIEDLKQFITKLENKDYDNIEGLAWKLTTYEPKEHPKTKNIVYFEAEIPLILEEE